MNGLPLLESIGFSVHLVIAHRHQSHFATASWYNIIVDETGIDEIEVDQTGVDEPGITLLKYLSDN